MKKAILRSLRAGARSAVGWHVRWHTALLAGVAVAPRRHTRPPVAKPKAQSLCHTQSTVLRESLGGGRSRDLADSYMISRAWR